MAIYVAHSKRRKSVADKSLAEILDKLPPRTGPRARNGAAFLGIHTLAALLKISPREFALCPNVGKTTTNVMRAALRQEGIVWVDSKADAREIFEKIKMLAFKQGSVTYEEILSIELGRVE